MQVGAAWDSPGAWGPELLPLALTLAPMSQLLRASSSSLQ